MVAEQRDAMRSLEDELLRLSQLLAAKSNSYSQAYVDQQAAAYSASLTSCRRELDALADQQLPREKLAAADLAAKLKLADGRVRLVEQVPDWSPRTAGRPSSPRRSPQ